MPQIETMGNSSAASNKVGDAYFWNGRPDWDQVFARVKSNRKAHRIGVCFCGATAVGKDLKRMCGKYSNLKEGELRLMSIFVFFIKLIVNLCFSYIDCFFTLHKENF